MAVSYISSATAEATTLTMPSHQAGDMLIMFAFQDGSTTIPTLPAGWTSIQTRAGTSCAARLGYKIAASSSETSGTWTTATVLVCHTYRGTDTAPGTSTSFAGVSATLTYSQLIPGITDGTSWVAAFGAHRSTNGNMGTAPAGMVNRSNMAGSSSDAAGHDTDGGTTLSAFSQPAYGGTSSGFITCKVEIPAGAVAASNTGAFFAMF